MPRAHCSRVDLGYSRGKKLAKLSGHILLGQLWLFLFRIRNNNIIMVYQFGKKKKTISIPSIPFNLKPSQKKTVPFILSKLFNSVHSENRIAAKRP